MARKIRSTTKKEDKFQFYIGRLFKLIRDKRTAFLRGGLGFVVVAAGYGTYLFWTERIAKKSSSAYGLAQLKAPGGKGLAVEEALLKTAVDYPRTRAGIMARLQLASLLRERGDYRRAEAEIRSILENSAITETDSEIAMRGLAASIAGQGKCDQALAIWQKLISDNNRFSVEDIYVAAGKCYEKDGKDAAALKMYEELSQKYPRSPFLDAVLRERIRQLGKNE